MSISMTDVKVSKNVLMSRQLYNTNRELYDNYARYAQSEVEILSKVLNVPENMYVRVCGIKARNVNGRYLALTKTCEVDPRKTYSYRSFIRVLAHEMVHAEQFHENRLMWSAQNRSFMWNDELSKNKGTTYKRYRGQPWEVEAFGRQDDLAEIVFKQLNIY